MVYSYETSDLGILFQLEFGIVTYEGYLKEYMEYNIEIKLIKLANNLKIVVTNCDNEIRFIHNLYYNQQIYTKEF